MDIWSAVADKTESSVEVEVDGFFVGLAQKIVDDGTVADGFSCSIFRFIKEFIKADNIAGAGRHFATCEIHNTVDDIFKPIFWVA